MFDSIYSSTVTVPQFFIMAGVALVSGASQRLFSMIAGGVLSPYAFMMDVLGSERYAMIAA